MFIGNIEVYGIIYKITNILNNCTKECTIMKGML